MPTKPQCPTFCVCSLICKRETLRLFLSQMFGPYRDEIAPHKGRVVFVADRPGANPGRRLVYELWEFSHEALYRCAEHLITASDQGEDIYFQPTLIRPDWPQPIPGRKERRFKKNAAYVDVYRAVGIFLDVDVHKRPGNSPYRTDEEAALAAREALESRGIKVDAVVESGSGYHFHIRLVNDGKLLPEDVREYTARCRELILAVGVPVDPQSKSAVQVARLPGTINHKADTKHKVVTVSHSQYAQPQSIEPFEALPPAPQPNSRYSLVWPMDALFSPADLLDEGLTRYRNRLTPVERLQFETQGMFDKNMIPAHDKTRRAWLPFRPWQTHRLPRYQEKSGPPQSGSEFDYNGIVKAIDLLEDRIKPNIERLLEIAKILAVEHYDLRIGRAAPRRSYEPDYWTITALNAAFAGSAAFRDAVWQLFLRKRLAYGDPYGKLPPKIPSPVVSGIFDTGKYRRKSPRSRAFRINRFMARANFVVTRRGHKNFICFINRDARDADRAKRRRQSPTPASVELSLRQLARQLRKLAAGNAPPPPRHRPRHAYR